MDRSTRSTSRLRDGWDARTNVHQRRRDLQSASSGPQHGRRGGASTRSSTVTEPARAPRDSEGQGALLALLRELGLSQPRLKVMRSRLGAEASAVAHYDAWRRGGRELPLPKQKRFAVLLFAPFFWHRERRSGARLLLDFPGPMGETLADLAIPVLAAISAATPVKCGPLMPVKRPAAHSFFGGQSTAKYLALRRRSDRAREKRATEIWELENSARSAIQRIAPASGSASSSPAIQGNYEESRPAERPTATAVRRSARQSIRAALLRLHRGETPRRAKRWWDAAGDRAPRARRQEMLLCHGSPRKINEFLWRSMEPRALSSACCAARRRRHSLHAHRMQWSRLDENGRRHRSTPVRSAGPPNAEHRVWFTIIEERDGPRVERCR